jgi:hypothetical protein
MIAKGLGIWPAGDGRARGAQGGPSATRTGAAEPAKPFSGPGYVLSFSKDFNPGAASVDDLGISVVIAMDVSGSMESPPKSGGEPKYRQASVALGGIVDFLEKMSGESSMAGMKLKVGLMSFSTGVKVLYPLTEMGPQAFAALRAVAESPENLKPEGKTSIGRALELGAEILAGSGTVMKSLVVVSDGENTAGAEPQEVLMAINENRNSASSAEVPVYTRGILTSFVGFDVDSGVFSSLAAQGARLTSASDQSELTKALTDILVADISKLEAAQ